MILIVCHVVTRYRLGENAFRQLYRAGPELVRGQDLAARGTRHVGQKRLDIVDLAFLQPFLNGVVLTHDAPAVCLRSLCTRYRMP